MDDEPYGAVTVNLCHRLQSDELAFVDENNMPGIGKWLERNHIALSLCMNARSGFCEYPLYMFTIYLLEIGPFGALFFLVIIQFVHDCHLKLPPVWQKIRNFVA